MMMTLARPIDPPLFTGEVSRAINPKFVMARLDRATQRPRVRAANDSCPMVKKFIRGADAPRLGGPLEAGHDNSWQSGPPP
jgi:hypothetical protein